MHRFFVPELFQEYMQITGVNGRHIGKVLRMQAGERLQVVSDDGVVAEAEILSVEDEAVKVFCVKKIAESHEPRIRLTLAQGLTKGDKMDFIIQKAVELGVYSIIPVVMDHSVVRLEGGKVVKKVERWQKIAEAAAKQSKRDIIPRVQPVHNFRQMLAANNLAVKFIAYECELRQSLREALRRAGENGFDELLLIIGPEGGISDSEINLAGEAGAVAVSLGRRILRAETAGLVAMSAIFYETGDLGD